MSAEQLWALGQNDIWHAIEGATAPMRSLCGIRVDVDRKFVVGDPGHYLVAGKELPRCRSCLEKLAPVVVDELHVWTRRDVAGELTADLTADAGHVTDDTGTHGHESENK